MLRTAGLRGAHALAGRLSGNSLACLGTQPWQSTAAAFATATAPGGLGADATATAAAAAGRAPRSGVAQTARTVLGAAALAASGAVAYVGATYTLAETEALLGVNGPVQQSCSQTRLESPVHSACSWLLHVRAKASEHISYFADPSSPRLLPDLPPHAAAYTRTLVLDLDGILVKSDWTRERGWRTFKRPGVDAFLRHMSQYYELVVYTEQLATYGEPILERLDPQRFISYRLYRDATRYTRGTHCRDLSTLNRPLERVLLLTTDAKAAQLQPENALVIKPWDLDPNDTTLLDMLPFLESVVRRNAPDTRVVLTSYSQEMQSTGKDVATIFRERSARMQQYLQQRDKAPRTLFGARATKTG